MNYFEFNVGDTTYKLKLTTQQTVALEKALGKNPLGIFGNAEQLPAVTDMVNILFYSLLTFHHGIGLNDTYKIFDKFLEEHSMAEFIPVILDIYRVSGLIRDTEEAEEKN